MQGALIGMISEYCFRVEYGYLQGFILFFLALNAFFEIRNNWYK